MAHNLAVINGRTAMSWTGESPWHGLGTRMGEGSRLDVQAAMIAANLNWQVALAPHFLADGRTNPYSKAVIRDCDDAILGSVGPKTALVQNAKAFGILEPLTREFGVTIETAGALGNGARVWMLAKMPTTIAPVPGDDINGYFLIVHAHDNTHTLDGIPTPVRVVCQNTLSMAIESAGGIHSNSGRVFKVRKTLNADARVDAAAKLMTDFAKTMQETNETFASMAAKKLTPKEIAAYIESVFPMPKNEKGVVIDSKATTQRRSEVAEAVFASPGADLAGSDPRTGTSTAWGVLNAVTFWADHTYRLQQKTEAKQRQAAISAIFGTNAALKLAALAQARQLVAA